jgi:hypothetical protein
MTGADNRVVLDRMQWLRSAFDPFVSIWRWWLGGLLVACALGIAFGVWVDHDRTAAVVLMLALVAAVIAMWPLRRRVFRRALELYSDLSPEPEESPPHEPGEARRWLETHPDHPQRAYVLLRLGELDELDRAIEQLPVSTPEERFDAELLRAYRQLFAGERPDTSGLHAAWPETARRRFSRESLATLDATIAFADGGDPIEVLAAARDDVEVEPKHRTVAQLAEFIGVPALLGVIGSVLVVDFVRGTLLGFV